MGTSASVHGGSWMNSKFESFGERNFGNAELGDARRTCRLVKTADLMCRRPGGTLPQKLHNPKDQGHRIKILAKQEIFEETGVPGGFFSLLLQTGFRSVTLQQRGDKATYEAHVLGSMTVADATAVFAKHDIHHPV